MSRPLRIEYPHAWYHVLNRGRRREKIFFKESDYLQFFHIIGECSRLYNLEVHAYSLMPNHYHLLVCTPDGNISRIMRHLDGVYTQKINRRYKLEGSLFKGRFKSILVEESSYLMEIVRYIHKNPLKANLERQLGEHKWTSHLAYMDDAKRPKWLRVDHVLKKFGNYGKTARKDLQAFVLREMDKEIEKRLDSTNWPSVLGGAIFKNQIAELLQGKEIDKHEVPEYIKFKNQMKNISIKDLFEILMRECGIEGEEREEFLLKKSRKHIDIKRAFVYIGKEHIQASNIEIKELLGGVSVSLISKYYGVAKEDVKGKRGCFEIILKVENKIRFVGEENRK